VLATKHIDDVLSYPRGSLERLFTASELRSAEGLSRRNAVVRLSMVLAAKEASFKALGPLLRARRAGHPGSSTDLATDFRDIEIVGIDTPSPTGVPSGTLAESIRQSRPRLDALPVVVAHDRELAGAVALCVSCPST
jgi:phosphopantetheinyl transferase (holo-ACP synthase)